MSIKTANAYFRSGDYERALAEYEAITRSHPVLARSLDASIRLCYRRLEKTTGSIPSQIVPALIPLVSSRKLFRVRFNPDYSISNPYQTLLYSDCPPEFSILAGDLTEAQQDLVSGEFHYVYFHLHWISPIQGRATSVEEAERNTADYLAQLSHFVQNGGYLVWTIHNLFEHDSKYPEVELRLRVELVKLAKVIHVHSESALAQIAEHYPLPPEKVVIQTHGHYIGTYPDVVTRPLARAYLGLGQDDIVFLSLGQIRPYKGIDTLLAAFSAFHRVEPRARLVIAGKPVHPFSADLLRHYLRGYRGVTLRPENIPDTELQYYFRAADAAVLTYRRILTSGSVLLAESFGTACIGPDVPGLNDIIRHGENGFLYDQENSVDSLQTCFQSVADRSSTDREKLDIAARADAEQRPWTSAVRNLFASCLPTLSLTTRRPVTSRYVNTGQLSVPCQLIERNKNKNQEYLIGIVILNYKNKADTTELIQSIARLERNDLLIIIVDNASPNLILDELDTAFPQCDIIRTDANLGYAAGNNVGIQYLKDFHPRYIWILNPDTVIQRNTLDTLLKGAEQDTNPTIWGSVITYYDRPKTVWFAGGFVHFGRSCNIGHLYYNRDIGDLAELAPYDVDYITGASIFCRSDIFDQNGLLPEHYFLYFEETDWCQQAKKRGIQLKINPKSQLFHKKRSENASGLPKDYYFYYFIRGAIFFRKKYAQIPLDHSIAEIQGTFIDPWLARIKNNHADHFSYFQRLSQIAIQDACNGVGGRRDLYDLSVTEPRQNSQGNGIEIVAQISNGNVIEGRVSGHEWALALDLGVVIDGRAIGHLAYRPQPESSKTDNTEQRFQNHLFKFLIPSLEIDGATHHIELCTEDNQSLWQSTIELKTNPPNYKGRIDGINNRVLRGWCIDLANPQFPADITLLCEEKIVGIGKADRVRPDFSNAGFDTNVGGFEFVLPLRYCDGRTYEFTLVSKNQGTDVFRRVICMDVSKVPSIAGIEDENAMENWFFVNRELSFVRKENADSPWFERLEDRARQYANALKDEPQDMLVSVIMPVYNRESVVEQAIHSVVAQSYRNWELLVVDDGSQDQTVEKVRSFVKEMKVEERVHIIQQPQNAGVSAARNVGLTHAKGRLIAYLDSDNTWDQDFLLIMSNELSRLGNYACIYCGDRIKQIYAQTDNGEEHSEIIGIRYGRLHRTLLENKNYIDLNVFMHTRDLYDELGGFNEDMRRLVDWELIVRYAQTPNVGFVPAILATYVFGACDNQITVTEDYRKNAFAILSTIERLHEVRVRLAKKHQAMKIMKPNALDCVHVFIYTDQQADESAISMACSNWINAFNRCEISVTVLLDGTVENKSYEEFRINNHFNVPVIVRSKKEWLSIVTDNEKVNKNSHNKIWSVLTPINISPEPDFENALIERLADNSEPDFIIPACIRSNTYALRSDEIRFCNSLHEFDYDFQPHASLLELCSKKNPLSGTYDVLHASLSIILMRFGNPKDAKEHTKVKNINFNNMAEEIFEVNCGSGSKVSYSQNLRVHRV